MVQAKDQRKPNAWVSGDLLTGELLSGDTGKNEVAGADAIS